MLSLKVLKLNERKSTLSKKKFCLWFTLNEIQCQIKSQGQIVHGTTILDNSKKLEEYHLQPDCLLIILPDNLDNIKISKSVTADLCRAGCQECKEKTHILLEILTNKEIVSCHYDLKILLTGVKESYSVASAIKYLVNKCPICLTPCSIEEMFPLQVCDCHVCQDCLRNWLTVLAKDKDPGEWCCPKDKSHWDVTDTQMMEDLFSVITFYIGNDQELASIYALSQRKINTWRIMREKNFLWCSAKACTDGFLYVDRVSSPEAICPTCNTITCFDCKHQWWINDSLCHDNKTCHEFNYSIMNEVEPETASLIKTKGLSCPKCKFHFFEAKGGCLHFSCTKCGFQFCCGCGNEFLTSDKCKKCKEQRADLKGGHAHCPRNCIYFLRDFNVAQLEQLLKNARINYAIPTMKLAGSCEVVITDPQMVDKPCDAAIVKYNLCDTHYKEHLAKLINRNKLDPLDISDAMQIEAEIKREQKPKLTYPGNTKSEDYLKKLKLHARRYLPLVDLSVK